LDAHDHAACWRIIALTYAFFGEVRMILNTEFALDFVSYMFSIRGRRLRLVFEAISAHSSMELAESIAVVPTQKL
jgi:hypothetical protein